ncbi:MAG TPA: VOC family protein [Dongiaceae bacterium]|nr:VOC family protein [Dongiaceae bacterium]
MPNAKYILLYVDNPRASGHFYAGLLGVQPLEAGPTFVLFVLPSGLKLGLWSRHTAEPAPLPGGAPLGGGAEVGFTLDSRAEVDALYADWSGKDLRVIQKPTALDFGYTFVVLDPDGHRLRVFALEV